jgi:hypothetical protein
VYTWHVPTIQPSRSIAHWHSGTDKATLSTPRSLSLSLSLCLSLSLSLSLSLCLSLCLSLARALLSLSISLLMSGKTSKIFFFFPSVCCICRRLSSRLQTPRYPSFTCCHVNTHTHAWGCMLALACVCACQCVSTN